MIKHKLINTIATALYERLSEYKNNVEMLLESRDADTKSSAGDKYETSREMTQIEINKLSEMLNLNSIILKDLLKIDANLTQHTVELGSIVTTITGKYFISVAFGKIKVDNEEYYAISKTSPFASTIQGKKVGDKISFQNRVIEIIEII
jgi:transcription elongation GreA/GreB family factor